MDKLREETEQADLDKKKQLLKDQNAGYGYGGKFGVEKDRMDKSAVGHDYQGKVGKHASQKDYSDGFGGKFGVQEDRKDKSAVGWDHVEKVEKHASQKDYATGFGGKFGVQSDRVDKSAVGWDHIEKVEKHESQKGKLPNGNEFLIDFFLVCSCLIILFISSPNIRLLQGLWRQVWRSGGPKGQVRGGMGPQRGSAEARQPGGPQGQASHRRCQAFQFACQVRESG